MHKKQRNPDQTVHQVKDIDATHFYDGGSYGNHPRMSSVDAVTGSTRTSWPKLSLQTQSLTTVGRENRPGFVSDTTPSLLASGTSQCSQASRCFKAKPKIERPQSQSSDSRAMTPRRAEEWNRRVSSFVKNEAGQGPSQMKSQTVQPNAQNDSYQNSTTAQIGLVTTQGSPSAPLPQKNTTEVENGCHAPRSARAISYSDLSDKSHSINLSSPSSRRPCDKDLHNNLQRNRIEHDESPQSSKKSETYSPSRDFLYQPNSRASDNTDFAYSQYVVQDASDSLPADTAIEDSTNFEAQRNSSDFSRGSSATSPRPRGHRRLSMQDIVSRFNKIGFSNSPRSNARVETSTSTPSATAQSNVRGTMQNATQESSFTDLSIRTQSNSFSGHSSSTPMSGLGHESSEPIFTSSRNNSGSVPLGALQKGSGFLSHPLTCADSGWISRPVSRQGSLFSPRKSSLLRDWSNSVSLEQGAERKEVTCFEIQCDQENEKCTSVSSSKTSVGCIISKDSVQQLPSSSPVFSADINFSEFLRTGRLEPRAPLPSAIGNEVRTGRQNSTELDPLDVGVGKLESSLGSKMIEVGAAKENDYNVTSEQNKHRCYALCCNFVPQSLKTQLVSSLIQWTSKGAFKIQSGTTSRKSRSLRTKSGKLRRTSSLRHGAAITTFRRYYRSHRSIIAASERDGKETPDVQKARHWADINALRRQFGSFAGSIEPDLGF